MYASSPYGSAAAAAAAAPPPPPPALYAQPHMGAPVMATNYSYSNIPPALPQLQPSTPMPWSTGLCDCFDDCSNCCVTWCCPCITFGQIAEIVDQGTSSCVACGALYALIAYFTGFACLLSCFYRSKMRRQYMLQEDPCWDFLVHCCCDLCALCQEYRELKHRGFDMALGWQGNMEKQQRGVPMAPVAMGADTN
ncbi:hypothetical protein RJ640_003045 [Escallonia rubra]|uniref:Uncharacterized protein n=1 Tax=Escallonia rubra TaxID=112253 RepID=A0AA88UJZ9_9ASTE|nr:hypothetical protein RJ640_003045 [Escallonia rubra]